MVFHEPTLPTFPVDPSTRHGSVRSRGGDRQAAPAALPAMVVLLDNVRARLGSARLRITVVRLQLSGLGGMSARALAERLAASECELGRLPDGAFGLLYLGPRPTGIGADHWVVRRLGERFARLTDASAPRAAFSAVHAWTTDIVESRDLLAALESRRGRQLVA